MGVTFFGSVKYLGHVRSPLASHAGVFKNGASEARSPQLGASNFHALVSRLFCTKKFIFRTVLARNLNFFVFLQTSQQNLQTSK